MTASKADGTGAADRRWLWATAGLIVAVGAVTVARVGLHPPAGLAAPAAGLTAGAVSDLRHRRLPRRLIYGTWLAALTAAAIAATVAGHLDPLLTAAACGVGAWGLFAVAWRLDALGWGDVRLAGAVGAMTGWWGPLAAFAAIAAGFCLAAAASLVLIALHRLTWRGGSVPLGTYLAAATIAVIWIRA